MNELIRTLSEQAGFIHFTSDDDSNMLIDWSCDYTQELEKFAELIVWECINAISDVDENYIAVFQQHLLEHFGVE